MADDEHVLDEEDINLGSGYRAAPSQISGFAAGSDTLANYLETIEKTVIGQHLIANDGNVSQTARDLGMIRQNLQHKIRKYGL
jgi:arginine utilization regulatory protein